MVAQRTFPPGMLSAYEYRPPRASPSYSASAQLPTPPHRPVVPLGGTTGKRKRLEAKDSNSESDSGRSGRVILQKCGLESSESDKDAEGDKADTEPTSRDEESQSPSKSANDDLAGQRRKSTSGNPAVQRRKRSGREVSHVVASGPAYPRSSYDGWEPPIPTVPEAQAIADLQHVYAIMHANDEKPDYTFFQLEDFSVFRPMSKAATRELVTLDKLQSGRIRSDAFLLDGVLQCGGAKHYVRSLPFRTLTVEGYGDAEVASLQGRIAIQTFEGETQDVWYTLGQPSEVYRRFYEPFAWLAQFTKYFVDYLLETESVTLAHFRTRFYEWLNARYAADRAFRSWLGEARLKDFRTTVNANFRFLWKECHGIDDNETRLLEHPVWGEVNRDALTAIPAQPNYEIWTVVTPFAYDCFKHMYFHQHMRARPLKNPYVQEAVRSRKLKLGLTPLDTPATTDAFVPVDKSGGIGIGPEFDPFNVEVGDVVCTEPDLESPWRSTAKVWYAYVQGVRVTRIGRKRLDVLWLYDVGDTTLGSSYYPFANELFLSDNCACGQDALNADAILGKVDVRFFQRDPAAAAGALFVRQKFRTVAEEDTYDFVSLRQSDFRCRCNAPTSEWDDCLGKYRVNGTVLVLESVDGEKRLQPAQILRFDEWEQRIQLRRMLRKSEIMGEHNARPNELVLTSDTYSVRPEKVVRACQVRYFDPRVLEEGRLPTPYDRDGAGDFWFYTSAAPYQLNQVIPPHQGWDPESQPQHRKLTGMGIFCGGGNFDRGLEEGGAVEFKYAVDWAERALHSYRANAECPEDMHFFLGSVNDYMAQAIAGSEKENIARVGDVGLIAAGSPCPGFSRLQPDKQSHESLMNASMVASVVSFVDFYSPEYCVLENVVTMTQGMGANKNENVFAQILASFVALGYQVQQFLLDAWSVGDSQQRSRVFIVASAPGLAPWPAPAQTHAHPGFRVARLGRSSNGLPFGVRRDDYTPFAHISAEQACADLPSIGDAQPYLCPPFPDHRTPVESGYARRNKIALVPTRPYGMGIVQAGAAGLLPNELTEWLKSRSSFRREPSSKMLSRVIPNGLFPTIITTWRLEDGITGRTLHWDEHRSCSVMELRRAQGFPDWEVLVGTPPEQVTIIGNSVDRKVALALGLSLRQSWLQSFYADDDRAALATDNDALPVTGPETINNAGDVSPTASMCTEIPETAYEGSSTRPVLVPWSHKVPTDEKLREQSRTGTLRLSDAQVEEIRGGGFAAIRRILSSRDRRAASETPSTDASY